MKKILSLMLTALMTLSLFAIPASASETLPAIAEGDAIYAGEQSITIKLAAAETETALTDAQAALIKITNLRTNEIVEFTNVITGDILTLIPAESFEINGLGATDKTAYKLQLGDVTKVFTVDEIFKPTFAVATTGDTNSATDAEGEFVTGIDICLGNDATFDVIDENTIVFAGYQSTIVLDYPEIINYENASLVTDIYYFGDVTKRVSAVIGFNITDANKNTLFNGKKRGAVGRAGWIFQRNSGDENIKNHARMVAIPDTSTTSTNTEVKQFYGFEAGSSIAVLNPIGSAFDRAYTKSSNFSTEITDSAVIVGSESVALPEGFDTTKKYHYSVDKLGAVGTLMINGGLVDVLDTNDYYAQYNEANAASEVAPTTGYFLFTPYVDNSKIVMQNPRLITSEFYDFETGTIEAPSIYANKDFMTVTFAEDVSKADVNKITLSKDGAVVGCTKAIDKKKIIITPVGGFELDNAYTIEIAADFGWDAKTLAEEYSKDFKVKKFWQADLSKGKLPSKMYAKGYGENVTYAVQNGKIYLKNGYTPSLWIQGVVTNLDNYSFTYTTENYGTTESILLFNSELVSNGLYYPQSSKLFGWKNQQRNYSYLKNKSNWVKDGVAEVDASYPLTSTISGVKFETVVTGTDEETGKNITKTTVTLPDETATAYNYTLDKIGTTGVLYINNKYVDTNNTVDLMNALKAEKPEVTDDAPATGDILLGISATNHETTTDTAVAFSNLLVTTFEIIEDEIIITNVTYLDAAGETLESIKGKAAVKGTASIKNYYDVEKPLKFIAIAYAGDEMLAVDILDDISSLGAKESASAGYSFTGLSGLTEIKVVAWDSFKNLFPYCAPFIK